MTAAPTRLPRRPATHRPPAGILAAVIGFLAIAAVLTLVAHEHTFGSSSSSANLRGSGIPATETRALRPFTGVTLRGTGDVVIRAGGPQKVVVRADDNLLGNLTTKVTGGTLTIATTGSFSTVTPMRVAVAVPSIDTLTLSGSGTVTATGVRSPAVSVLLSGTGTIRAGGTSPRLQAMLDGTGALQLAHLVARDVQATLGGTGAIAVTATKTLDAAIPGTGQIVYYGFPAHVMQSVTGTGSIAMGPR